ncbi:MAG TPA: hypothetical protein VH599_14515 [Ktedonobacterales bacterium]
MSYKDVPHAAVNELMKWVRKQGKQVASLQTWPHLTGWSSLPDWFAHINVHRTAPLHVRIKRNGYRFTIIHEPDDTLCPTCCASAAVTVVSQDAPTHAPERALVTQQG